MNDSVAECALLCNSYLKRGQFELSSGTTALNVRHRDELQDEMSLLVLELVTITLLYEFEVHINRDEKENNNQRWYLPICMNSGEL